MSKRLTNVLYAYLSSRALCLTFAYLAHCKREFLSPVQGGWVGVSNWWINPWTTYDSQWLLSIAGQGYQEHTTPFFPLYPLLLKLGGGSEVGMALAGVIISNVCFGLALYVLQLLTEVDFDAEVAKVTVWIVAFFPTTAYFSAVYTESLFLLLLLISFYSARRQNWILAGVSGGLAALTRNPGFLIFVALALEYLQSANYDRRKLKMLPLFCTLQPLLAFLGVQLYFWNKFDAPLAGVTSQSFFPGNWVAMGADTKRFHGNTRSRLFRPDNLIQPDIHPFGSLISRCLPQATQALISPTDPRHITYAPDLPTNHTALHDWDRALHVDNFSIQPTARAPSRRIQRMAFFRGTGLWSIFLS